MGIEQKQNLKKRSHVKIFAQNQIKISKNANSVNFAQNLHFLPLFRYYLLHNSFIRFFPTKND